MAFPIPTHLTGPPTLISACWIRSTVINLMRDADSASTAFFYCARSSAEPARAKPVEILCALLRQLCTSSPDQPVKSPVAREYEARQKRAEEDCYTMERLTLEECTRLIIELTKDHPTTIVLDALDECEESTRHELLEALDSIICNSTNVVKIFVSSRDDIDIVSNYYLVNSWDFHDQKTHFEHTQAKSCLLTSIPPPETASGRLEKHLYQCRKERRRHCTIC